MVTRRVKPTSPGRRFQSYASFEEISDKKPEKSLLRIIKKSGGRNTNGRFKFHSVVPRQPLHRRHQPAEIQTKKSLGTRQ